MTKGKTGDPGDHEQHAGGARLVPVAGTYGTEVVVPGPLTAGRPQPEPEERWTLAPGHASDPLDDVDDDAATEGVPVEPVRAKVSSSAEEEGPDRS